MKNVRKAYEANYGVTRPCYFAHAKRNVNNFLGVERQGDRIHFCFKELGDEELSTLEMHLRNRLSRKISYELSMVHFSVDLRNFRAEELPEVQRAICDLKRFFSGKPMSDRLRAEISLFDKGLDWRDRDLVFNEELALI